MEVASVLAIQVPSLKEIPKEKTMTTVFALIAMNLIYVTLGAYFLIRLHWVKNFSTTVMMRSNIMYMALPSFRYMMWTKCFCWNDIEFLPNPEDLRRE